MTPSQDTTYTITGFDEYKPVRNFLRKYKKEDLLKLLIETSYRVSKEGPKTWEKGFVPWELLLLGRWLLRDWNKISGSKEITPSVRNKAINKVKNFTDRTGFLKSGSQHGLSKFMRQMAFQQLWLQTEIGHSSAGRAIKLLIDSPLSSEVDEAFKKKTGASRKTIFDIFMMLWASMYGADSNSIPASYFSKINTVISDDIIVKFFDCFALDISKIDAFNNDNKPRNYISEIHEKTPFYLKPLFYIDEKYYLWNATLLNELLEFGIYDVLKQVTPDKFGNCFGTIFEQYIANRLADYSIENTPESELKRNGYQKQVDFIIESDDTVVMIEAKGIEASKLAMINPTDEIMKSSYRKNIVKALAQAHYVFEKFNSDSKTNHVPFLLVITYKELFIGNGENAWDEFLAEELKESYSIEKFSIPIKNIFFLSIDGFDKYLLCSDGDKSKLGHILNTINSSRKDIVNKRFVFSHYLQDIEEFSLGRKIDNHLKETFINYHTEVIKQYFGVDIANDQR